MYLETNNCNQAFRVKYTVILAVTLFLALFILGCETSKTGNQNSQANQNAQQNQNSQANQNSQQSKATVQTLDAGKAKSCPEGCRCKCPSPDGSESTTPGNDLPCSPPCGCECGATADKPILVTGGSFEFEAKGITAPFDEWTKLGENDLKYPQSGSNQEQIKRVVIEREGYNPEEYTFTNAKVSVTLEYTYMGTAKTAFISTDTPDQVLVMHSDVEFNKYKKNVPTKYKKMKLEGADVTVTNIILRSDVPIGGNNTISHPVNNNKFTVEINYHPNIN